LNAIEEDSKKTVEQLKTVAEKLEAVITQLSKPKKFKFNIDRNFQTGRIQEVTAKQIE
jgi:hypothetical protein